MLKHSRMQQGRDDGGVSGIQGKDVEVLQYGHSIVDVFSACKANLVRSPVPWMNGMELLEDVLKNKRALPTGFDGTGKEGLGNHEQNTLPINFDIFSLMDALDELKNTMREQKVSEEAKICILVVDAISSLVTPILGSTNAQGRSLMVFTGYLLKRLAYELDISVLVTNHMVSGEGGMAKPAMGESWKPVPHIRLLISRKPGSKICDISLLRHTSMLQVGLCKANVITETDVVFLFLQVLIFTAI
ncbi:hypothetical protein HPP92_017953 [Vanilla planifolia]|uniref:RecA family profile 1 domain-containing protein n=1 Tax=Vanilla planifolia TaxID=51239 RepID=A0A835ULZ7_VANPL|nr:hypothetical protein HPP92_017953 [Vanilla planifolia]